MRAGYFIHRVAVELAQALFLLRRSRLHLGNQIKPLGDAGDWRGLCAVNSELVKVVDVLQKIRKSKGDLPRNITLELAPSTIASTNEPQNASNSEQNGTIPEACKADDLLEHD